MTLRLNVYLLLLLACACGAARADDARERQLELDVAQLRRELLAQSRRIDELERQTARGVRESPATTPLVSPAVPAWLVATNWERIRPRMSEAEVMQVLGTPTSTREGTAQQKTLFYALEIVPEAYLAGSVEMTDGRVSEVRKPVLR